MDKYHLLRKSLAVGVILLFVCGALMPACSAQISTPQTNRVKTSHDCEVKEVKPNNNDNESFFTLVLVWGTYEGKWGGGPLIGIRVYNPGPWYNRTMNVIGYQNWEHKWVVKKSYSVDCRYWLGFAVLHHVCGIGYDVTAW